MFDSHKLGRAALVLAVTATAGSAHAHYILLKPDAMYAQDMSALGGGGPQKGGPCGPGGFDDDGSGTPTNKVTEVKAGDTLHVTWQTTVDHPGYFRIALAKDASEFMDPTFTDPVVCDYDQGAVKSGAHDNVLMDNIMSSATSQDVKIPDAPPCTDCTLQVIQVMYKHGPPNCIYYHCAKLKVTGGSDPMTAGAGGSAGSAGSAAGSGGMAGSAQAGSMSAAGSAAAGMTGSMGTAGMAMAQAGSAAPPPTNTGTTPPVMMMMQPISGGPGTGAAGSAPPAAASGNSDDSGGCAIASPGRTGARSSWLLLGLAAFALSCRRPRRRRALR
jgi:hypothetical protein